MWNEIRKLNVCYGSDFVVTESIYLQHPGIVMIHFPHIFLHLHASKLFLKKNYSLIVQSKQTLQNWRCVYTTITSRYQERKTMIYDYGTLSLWKIRCSRDQKFKRSRVNLLTNIQKNIGTVISLWEIKNFKILKFELFWVTCMPIIKWNRTTLVTTILFDYHHAKWVFQSTFDCWNVMIDKLYTHLSSIS